MKKIIVVLMIVAFLCVGCVTTAPQPDKDRYMFLNTLEGWALQCFEKGEFDLTDQERGYPIFNSQEEAMEWLADAMGLNKREI